MPSFSRRARVAAAWAITALFVSTPLYLYSRVAHRPPRVNVRWAPDVDAGLRGALEMTFQLTEGEFREGQTWSYVIRDVRSANVAAIIADPRVEDTSGIDRRSFVVNGAPGPLDGAGGALALGFAVSTLVFVVGAQRRTVITAIGSLGRGIITTTGSVGRKSAMVLGPPIRAVCSRESPVFSSRSRSVSAVCFTVCVSVAVVIKAPSWVDISWDDEELFLSILTTALHARYWAAGEWLPLWNQFQGFGLPHPSATHLIYSPLLPLMLVLPDGIALSLHYSAMAAIGVGAMFVLARRLGANAQLAAVGALTWLSSSYVTQVHFVDLWTQAFTFANLTPILVILLIDWFDPVRARVPVHRVLQLGLVAGIVINCTTPAASVLFAVPLLAMAVVQFRSTDRARVLWLVPAFIIALAMYAPVLVGLWLESGRFHAPRAQGMSIAYPEMALNGLQWPMGGYSRAAGFGAPFMGMALFAVVAALVAKRSALFHAGRHGVAVAAATCLLLYLLPGDLIPAFSGNGTWGQFFTVFAAPLAAAQVTALGRRGGPRLRLGLSLLVVSQLLLIGYWGAYWWTFQTRAVRSGAGSVGQLLGEPSELEQALIGKVHPDRDRILLSPLAQQPLYRQMKNGHLTNFARLGTPVVNGRFKFVSYQQVYPDLEMTWGAVMTHGERLDPKILDLAGISLLVTLDNEKPPDASLRRVGRYWSRSQYFQVWENLDVWPRASFIASPTIANTEAGTVLWRRRLLPSRLGDDLSLHVLRPGSYAIQFEPAPSERLLLISNVVRPDLMTIEGAALVGSGPLADVFAILKVPAGSRRVTVTWEAPLRRWLWRLSYLTFGLVALGWALSRFADRTSARPLMARDTRPDGEA